MEYINLCYYIISFCVISCTKKRLYMLVLIVYVSLRCMDKPNLLKIFFTESFTKFIGISSLS